MKDGQIKAATPVEIPSRDRIIFIILAVASAIMLIVAFGSGLAEMVRRWSVEEEYGHAFFLPVISLWLLWSRRAAIKESLSGPSRLAWPVFAVGVLFLVIGELAALFLLLHLGFLISLCAFILAFGGRSLLRITAFPVFFLLFTIPVPYFLEAGLTWQLQLISSELGAFILRLFSIPVFLQGNMIDLGHYQLQVVEACAGLRYLYPLMSLGVLAAYLFQAPLIWRIFLFLTTIPITIFFNSLRIAFVGFSLNLFGTAAAGDALHAFEGWAIFMACAIMLMIEIWLIARFIFKKSVFEVFYLKELSPIRSESVEKNTSARFNHLASMTAFLFFIMIGQSLISDRQEEIPLRASFAAFPDTIGNWQAHPDFLNAGIAAGLKVDDYFLSNFTTQGETVPVNVYMAYYASQRKGASPHSPRVCIPTGGWRISELTRKTFNAGPGVDQTINLNRVIISRGKEKQLVYYWFRGRGRDLANEYVMKWFLLTDAIIMNRTDGALIRLTTPITNNTNEADAEQRLENLLTSLLPHLDHYVPGDNNFLENRRHTELSLRRKSDVSAPTKL